KKRVGAGRGRRTTRDAGIVVCLHPGSGRSRPAHHRHAYGEYCANSRDTSWMLKVGLTGGYATGKSLVAAELERLGCHLIYADKLGHAVLSPDGAAYHQALDVFGRE